MMIEKKIKKKSFYEVLIGMDLLLLKQLNLLKRTIMFDCNDQLTSANKEFNEP
jgi:hypothetical protein